MHINYRAKQSISDIVKKLGNITDEMVNEYLEHHRIPSVNSDENFILE